VLEGSTPLAKPEVAAVRLDLESDRSFVSWEEALAHTTGPALDPATNVVWNQTLLDVLLEYPIRSESSRFSFHSTLARLGVRVLTVLRYVALDGSVRAFEFEGDPGVVPLDPGWFQAAARFVELGFFHILDGADHLLFLFCLVIPFRRLGTLIPIVTAFTAAHSITLIASAYGWAPTALWFPPLIETLIAASIVYMAFENIVGALGAWPRGSGDRQIVERQVVQRWMIAFGFGLIHGFGFSFALRETMQFAGSHLLTSLLSFNVGVEFGQILVLVAVIPLLELMFRFAVQEKVGTVILSALVAHTGWHWMVERAGVLARFHVEWPEWNAAFFANVFRWAMLMTAVAGVLWLVRTLARRARSTPEALVKAKDVL